MRVLLSAKGVFYAGLIVLAIIDNQMPVGGWLFCAAAIITLVIPWVLTKTGDQSNTMMTAVGLSLLAAVAYAIDGAKWWWMAPVIAWVVLVALSLIVELKPNSDVAEWVSMIALTSAIVLGVFTAMLVLLRDVQGDRLPMIIALGVIGLVQSGVYIRLAFR